MLESFQKLDEFYKLLAASALGGVAIKVLDVLWNQFIAEFFEKRRLTMSDKRQMADNIIALCAEGDAIQYKELPRDENAVHLLLNQLESIGSSVQLKLLSFYNYWVTVSTIYDNSPTKENMKFLIDMTSETDRRRKSLLKAVGKWKK